jgi:hypothetical protein
MAKDSQIRQRLANLKERLKQENPVLSQVVDSFQELDYISRRLGFMTGNLMRRLPPGGR